VHRTIGARSGWRISHVRTGLGAFGMIKSRESAIDAAKRMARWDWNFRSAKSGKLRHLLPKVLRVRNGTPCYRSISQGWEDGTSEV
jgi:hypothetical protein